MAGSGPPDNAPRTTPLEGGRLSAPSAERNTEPLIRALTPWLSGRSGSALEIGCGTGQHCAAWAAAFPALDWQPTDATDDFFPSVCAWGGPSVRAPMVLDAAAPWPRMPPLGAVISVNVIHISPWQVARGIVAGAANALTEGGVLLFYGPFREGGIHTGEGNQRFDESLRARDPRWGIRDLEAVADLAATAGFGPAHVTEMPANNRLVGFHRRPAP